MTLPDPRRPEERFETELVSVQDLQEGDRFVLGGKAVEVRRDAEKERRKVVVWTPRGKQRFPADSSVRKIVKEIRDPELEARREAAIKELSQALELIDAIRSGVVPESPLDMLSDHVESARSTLAEDED